MVVLQILTSRTAHEVVGASITNEDVLGRRQTGSAAVDGHVTWACCWQNTVTTIRLIEVVLAAEHAEWVEGQRWAHSALKGDGNRQVLPTYQRELVGTCCTYTAHLEAIGCINILSGAAWGQTIHALEVYIFAGAVAGNTLKVVQIQTWWASGELIRVATNNRLGRDDGGNACSSILKSHVALTAKR